MIGMEFQRHRISQDITKQQQWMQSQTYIAGSKRLAPNNQIENIIEKKMTSILRIVLPCVLQCQYLSA